MKITMLLFAITIGFSTVQVNAQTEKGTYLLGGGASFQSIDGSTVIIINPGAGYFFKNDLALGASFAVYFLDGDNSFFIGPYAKYYLGKKTSGKFFGTFSLNVGGASSDISLGAGLGAGYAFFLNKNIAFETGAYYTRYSEVNLFTLNLGFQIHLKKKIF